MASGRTMRSFIRELMIDGTIRRATDIADNVVYASRGKFYKLSVRSEIDYMRNHGQLKRVARGRYQWPAAR